MAKPKFKPTQKQLKTAWVMKKDKKKIPEICKELGISVQQYGRARDTFNGYFNERLKNEALNALKKGIPEQVLKTKRNAKPRNRAHKPTPGRPTEDGLEENDFDLYLLRAYSILSYTHDEIASLLMMSPSTLRKYRNKYPAVDYAIKNGKKQASANMVKAMQIQAEDRLVEDTAVASFQGNISTKRIKRHAVGNSQLIKLWMTNEEGWSSEPKKEGEDQKGVILATLDKLNASDDDAD